MPSGGYSKPVSTGKPSGGFGKGKPIGKGATGGYGGSAPMTAPKPKSTAIPRGR